MRRQLLTGLTMFAMMTVLVGVIYPLAVTGVAQLAFGHQANGSIIESDGRPVASSLIGQRFEGPGWFHPDRLRRAMATTHPPAGRRTWARPALSWETWSTSA